MSNIESKEVTPGELLQKERLKQGLTIEDVANSLHLTVQNINYLENNEFDKLPGDVFVRGYLRLYARLLGLYSDDLISNYAKLVKDNVQEKDEENSFLIANTRKKNKSNYLIVMLLGIGVVFGCVWFINNWQKAQQITQEESIINNELSNLDEISSEEIFISTVEEHEEDELDTNIESKLDLEQQIEEPITKSLYISFGNDCWVKVVDANKQILIDAIYKKGQNIEVNGKEPFNVSLGNARNVKVSYGDEIIEVKPRSSGSANFVVTSKSEAE